MKTIIILLLGLTFSISLLAQQPKINKQKIAIAKEILELTNGRENAIKAMLSTENGKEDLPEGLMDYLVEHVDLLMELVVTVFHDNLTVKELKELRQSHLKKKEPNKALKKKILTLTSQVAYEAEKVGIQLTIEFLENQKSASQKIFEQYSPEEAILKIDSILQQNPTDYLSLFYKAKCYALVDDYPIALEWINKSLDNNAEFAEAHFVKSLIYTSLYQINLSQESAEKALELNPDNIEYLENLGNVYISLGLYEEAIPIFSKLIVDDKTGNYLFYIHRASAYKYKRAHDKAMKDYEDALWRIDEQLEKKPKDVRLLVDKANVFLELNDYTKTIETLLEAIDIAPKYVYLREMLSVTYMRTKDYQKAFEVCDYIVNVDPKNIANYNQRGYCLLQLKEYKKAIEDFDFVIQHLPEFFYSYSNRGLAKLYLNEQEAAEKDIQHAISLKPSNPYALKNLGLFRLAEGKKEEACSIFNDCINKGFTELYGDENLLLLKEHCN